MRIKFQSIVIGIIGTGLVLAGVYLLFFGGTHYTGSGCLINSQGAYYSCSLPILVNNYPTADGLTLITLGIVILVIMVGYIAYTIKRKHVSPEIEQSTKSSGMTM